MLTKTRIATMVGAALVSASALAQSEAWWRLDREPRVATYSLTDGRSGGAGVPSVVNGAVPSTSPAEDLERLKSGDHASASNGFSDHSLLEPNRFVQ